jgi:hypothetical protein
MKKNILYYLIILFILFYSCNTTKNFSFRSVKYLSQSQIYDSIYSSLYNFSSYSSRINISLKSDKSLNLKGQIRVLKDSIIWISLSPGMGFEVARVMMKPDSVFVLDRIRNTYYYGNYSYVKQLSGINLNFNTVQSLLLNELFIYNSNSIDTSFFNNLIIQYDKDKGLTKLKSDTKSNSTNFYTEYIVNNKWKIASIFVDDYKTQRKIDIQYSDYITFDSLLFPKIIDINIIDSSLNIINANINYSKPEFNKSLNFPFSVPNKFVKVNY